MDGSVVGITENASPTTSGPANVPSKQPTDSRTEATSSNSSIISRTSTEQFHHVPFNQFSQQVRELCHQLWSPPENPSRVERILGARSNFIVGRLRAKDRSLPSRHALSSKELLIERLSGGSFNRVIGLTRFPESETPTRLVLRIPRFEYARHDHEVAAIRFVRSHTTIPVPEVKFVDYTENNPLKERYVIQTRISGDDLQGETGPCWFPSLNHEQKCTVAKVLAETLLELHKVTHPFPGHIEASNTNGDCDTFSVRHFELNWNDGLALELDLNTKSPFFQARPFKTDWKIDLQGRKPFEETTYHFMLAQFGRWNAFNLRQDPTSIGWFKYYDRLADMAKQMEELGFLGDDENCLCHRDLNASPRNIMADINPDKSLSITGILDWDSLVFAPTFVACVPPMWLWAWDTEEEEDERKANDIPTTPEQREIKRIFEETIGDWYCQYAYAPEYRLARDLFKFAHSGLGSDTDMQNVDRLLDDWKELYESHTKESNDEAKDGESFKSSASNAVEHSG